MWGYIVTMTRTVCYSMSGYPRTNFTSPTTPSCRTLSTAGGGSEAATLTSPACQRTYVTGECTTTYIAHKTALMGLRSTPRSPLRCSLSATNYNFKKANWETFTTALDNYITSLASQSWKAYTSFSDLVCVCPEMHPSWLNIRHNPRIC